MGGAAGPSGSGTLSRPISQDRRRGGQNDAGEENGPAPHESGSVDLEAARNVHVLHVTLLRWGLVSWYNDVPPLVCKGPSLYTAFLLSEGWLSPYVVQSSTPPFITES